ncbi:MAG: hypothetical protein KY445_10550 [Armatimonadetes bacterium]|nr:hypothetical protein [Armatimonadota bacterium]
MPRVLACATLLALTAIWLLSGRGGLGVAGQWVLQPNARPWPLGAWLLPLGVLLIFGGAAALSIYDRFRRAKDVREKRNSTLTALFCLALLSFLWPWALLGPGDISQSGTRGERPHLTFEGRFNIIAALWSDVATEYFGVAYQIDNPLQFGREYAQKWQKPVSPFQAHVATHPPGAVLFFYGARRVYEAVPALQNGFTALAPVLTQQSLADLHEGANVLRASASRGVGAPTPPLPISAIGGALWTAFLLGMSLVVAIPAVYGLASLGSDGDAAEARGFFAVGLWVLAPTLNLFAFTLDAPIAAGTAWTLYFVARACHEHGRARRFNEPEKAQLWMALAGATLALTSFLSLGALAVGLILVLALALFHRELPRKHLLDGVCVFAITWILLALIFSFNPLEVARNALAVHRAATLQNRSWAPWAVMNLIVWVAFAGYALVVCLFRKQKPTPIGAQFGLAGLITLLVLSLSGNVRGEVERLWLFLLAPAAIWAASGDFSPRVRAILLVLQAAQTLLMAATLGPLVRP